MTEVPIICRANQWTGFYMVGTSVMKELKPSRQLHVQSVSSVSVVNFEQVNAGWEEYPFHGTTHKCGFNMETILF